MVYVGLEHAGLLHRSAFHLEELAWVWKSPGTPVQILVLSLTHCVTWGKSLSLLFLIFLFGKRGCPALFCFTAVLVKHGVIV